LSEWAEYWDCWGDKGAGALSGSAGNFEKEAQINYTIIRWEAKVSVW